jgi:hypothetical protein
MSLCWKCTEFADKYSFSWQLKSLFHCHHDEPEEKPKEKCWCEDRYKNPIRFTDRFGYIMPNFCFQCGKKLNA